MALAAMLRVLAALSLSSGVAALTLSAAAELLQVPVGASKVAIRAAFRRQAARSHPDVSSGHTVDFLRVRAAYEVCIQSSRPDAMYESAYSSPTPQNWSQSAPPEPPNRVDSDLFHGWHDYWRVALAANEAQDCLRAQQATCSSLASELRRASGSDAETHALRERLSKELSTAKRVMQFVALRAQGLRERAGELQSHAMGI